MNRKKTGTGPDRNRLQPDLRLWFIRPENITGCGSSKFGKWVNRYRAGWDRSQPVSAALYSHNQPRPSDNAKFDNADQGNYDHPSDTRADCSDADVNALDRPQHRSQHHANTDH